MSIIPTTNWITGFCLALPALFSVCEAQPTCRVLVLNAATQRPVIRATVTVAGHVTQTDHQGNAAVPCNQNSIQVSCVGYAPYHARNYPDTLYLQPRTESLPNVTVTVRRQETTLQPSGKPFAGRFNSSPGSETAVVLTSPDTSHVLLAKYVKVPMPTGRRAFTEGRLLIAVHTVSSEGPSPLGTRLTDWLPIDAMTARRARHNYVLLDVSKYKLVVPATGLVVAVRCTLTTPEEQLLAVIQTPLPKHPELLTTTYRIRRANGQTQLVAATQFPQLYSLLHAQQLVTWERASAEAPWWHRSASTAITPTMRFNRHLGLVVEQLE